VALEAAELAQAERVAVERDDRLQPVRGARDPDWAAMRAAFGIRATVPRARLPLW
jgi:hypothetical protein